MFTSIVKYPVEKDNVASVYLLEKERELLRPMLASHRGHEIRAHNIGPQGVGLKGWLAGPSKSGSEEPRPFECLVEFANAFDATTCAIEIQRKMHEHNQRTTATKQIRLRIGLHAGSVEKRGGEVVGEGVSVASRIAFLASGNEILLSGDVWNQVKSKVSHPAMKLETPSLDGDLSRIGIFRLEPQSDRTHHNEREAKFDPRRLAVLPFANFSSDPNDEYFADGMTEELITSLSGLKELTVIARTSVKRYKDVTKSASEIGKELNAATLVEGSVRKAGNRVRVSVQLIDSRTEGHIWVQNYDRELNDIFTIQSELAERVSKELRIQLVESERKRLGRRPTESTEAYTLYLKGRHQLNKRTKEGLARALEYFKIALDTDPKFALPHVGISECHSVSDSYGYRNPPLAREEAKQAATRAVELDEGSGEAHLSLAWVLMDDWDWEGSEREFRHALELTPSDPMVHRMYAHWLVDQSREHEAMDELNRSLELDPNSPFVYLNIAEVLFLMSRYEEAITTYEKALEMESDHVPTLLSFVYALADRRMFSRAIEVRNRLLRLNFPEPRTNLFLAYVLAKQGMGDESRKLLTGVLERSASEFVPLEEIAAVYVALGNRDTAFEFLSKAIDMKSVGLTSLRYSARFESLRSDIRFDNLLRRMSLDRKRIDYPVE